LFEIPELKNIVFILSLIIKLSWLLVEFVSSVFSLEFEVSSVIFEISSILFEDSLSFLTDCSAEDITYSVLDGKSAFVLYKNEIAWKDELIQNIVENIEKDSPNMKTTIDVPESHSEPNEYILRKYCGDDEERSKYWPSAENTVAKFLARNPRAVLNRSNVILDMVYSKTPEKWIDFAEEYHSYFDEYDEQHGALVLFIIR